MADHHTVSALRRLTSSPKKLARHLTDRVMLPYVEMIRSSPRVAHRVPEAAEAPDGGPSIDIPDGGTSDMFHLALHELRSVELERVPKGAREVLSVGANGAWYFSWFEQHYGTLDRHVGVEAFESRPDDLPDHVDWIANTADRMESVGDASIDLVYAGQTTEHLWASELAGFLAEAHRVLRPRGLLVLDSPNRLVTERLHWSHGGHTVELSPAEIGQLIELAGFSMEFAHGVWSCVEGGEQLTLEQGLGDPSVLARRSSSALDRPDDAFVWWVVARRTDREPDRDGLLTTTKALYAQHWSSRVSRGIWRPGDHHLDLPVGTTDPITSTLPFPLHEGHWDLTLRLTSGGWSAATDFRVEIVEPGGEVVHRLTLDDATIDGDEARWTFHQPFLLFALRMGFVVGSVTQALRLAVPIDLHPSPTEPGP